jgi:hypothetical protein
VVLYTVERGFESIVLEVGEDQRDEGYEGSNVDHGEVSEEVPK